MRAWSRTFSTAPTRSCRVPTWRSKKARLSDRSRSRIPRLGTRPALPDPVDRSAAQDPLAETPALAHRVVGEAAMGADAAASAVEDRPGPGTLRHCLLEEGVQPAPRHEADLLALRLVRSPQPERGSDLADLRLRVLTDRKVGPGQLGLVQHVEHIALALGPVAGTQQPAPPRDGVDPGV